MEKRNDKVNPQRKRKRITKEVKLEAVGRLERGEKPATHLTLELGVARNQRYKWQTHLNCGLYLSEIATHLDIHYTTASKVVNG